MTDRPRGGAIESTGRRSPTPSEARGAPNLGQSRRVGKARRPREPRQWAAVKERSSPHLCYDALARTAGLDLLGLALWGGSDYPLMSAACAKDAISCRFCRGEDESSKMGGRHAIDASGVGGNERCRRSCQQVASPSAAQRRRHRCALLKDCVRRTKGGAIP
uniref:Uncharacterized protein n=1 Tax=Plectus sambesii TaxID=2011161 RepID=A0A914UT39_9BILA